MADFSGTQADVSRRSPIPLIMVAVAVLAAGIGGGWLLFGGDDGLETTADASSTTTAASSTTIDDDTDTDTDTETDTDTDAGADSGADNDAGADTDPASTDSSVDNAAQAGDADDGAAVPTTAGNGSTTSTAPITTTDETVESDDAVTEDDDLETEDPTEIATTTTATVSSGGDSCQVVPGDLNGQAGVVKPGGDGVCAGIEVTLRSVADSADLANADWANDIKLCEKHPSATQIGFTVTASSGPTDVTDNFFRGDVADGADPVVSLDVNFAGGYTSGGGVQPIAVCRTSDAELVIVHRANG